MARQTITDMELNKVGILVRGKLAQPFKMLGHQFDQVIGSREPDREFELLPVRHATALDFANPSGSIIAIPRQLALHSEDEAAFASWAKDKLSAQLIDGFWSLLDDHWAEDPEKKQRLQLVAA
jgi:hypothetical protein